jgi:hypothetical protein
MNRDHSPSELDERTRQDLARLADGSLQGRARTRLEARVAASPTLRAALERQRSGAAALRGLELEATPGLRARIAAQRATPSRSVRRRRFAIGGALAAATAAAALLAVLLLPSGAGGPTVVEAARLSERPATGSVQVAPSNPKLLAASVEGVPFPNWTGQFGWRESGTRTDRLDDREARTVFYERHGKRVAYTIVSGDGIPAPSDSIPAKRNGVKLHSLGEGGRQVVTWWRDGRTCVLSGTNVGDRQLIKLASWKGDGAVPF